MKVCAGELDVANTVETPTSSKTQPEQLVQDGENSAVTLPTANRNDVLKACVNTSGALAIAGIAIRQVICGSARQYDVFFLFSFFLSYNMVCSFMFQWASWTNVNVMCSIDRQPIGQLQGDGRHLIALCLCHVSKTLLGTLQIVPNLNKQLNRCLPNIGLQFKYLLMFLYFIVARFKRMECELNQFWLIHYLIST